MPDHRVSSRGVSRTTKALQRSFLIFSSSSSVVVIIAFFAPSTPCRRNSPPATDLQPSLAALLHAHPEAAANSEIIAAASRHRSSKNDMRISAGWRKSGTLPARSSQ